MSFEISSGEPDNTLPPGNPVGEAVDRQAALAEQFVSEFSDWAERNPEAVKRFSSLFEKAIADPFEGLPPQYGTSTRVPTTEDFRLNPHSLMYASSGVLLPPMPAEESHEPGPYQQQMPDWDPPVQLDEQ